MLPGCTKKESEPSPAPTSQPGALRARTFNSGFESAHDTYNGMLAASDGKIYYVLSSTEYNIAGQMYSYDPATGAIKHLGDLTEACGEKEMKVISQGKSHVNFVEHAGKLYFATHLGYYTIIEDMEKAGIPPPGWKSYRGVISWPMTWPAENSTIWPWRLTVKELSP